MAFWNCLSWYRTIISLPIYNIARTRSHLFRTLVDKHSSLQNICRKRWFREFSECICQRFISPSLRFLHELQATTAEQIAKICNISMQEAKHRAERMAILEARNKYYLHPLERQVRKQFGDYIKKTALKATTFESGSWKIAV